MYVLRQLIRLRALEKAEKEEKVDEGKEVRLSHSEHAIVSTNANRRKLMKVRCILYHG